MVAQAEEVLGSPGHPKRSWDAAQETPTFLSVTVSLPPANPLKPWEAQGPQQHPVYNRGCTKHHMDKPAGRAEVSWLLSPSPDGFYVRPQAGQFPPAPASLPLSSEKTRWVVVKDLPALTVQGFGILEVT